MRKLHYLLPLSYIISSFILYELGVSALLILIGFPGFIALEAVPFSMRPPGARGVLFALPFLVNVGFYFLIGCLIERLNQLEKKVR